MKQSARAARLRRHLRRNMKPSGLNLVSLMDIFTILVFFLMVNSSDVQVLNQNASVRLPLSVAEQPPKETLAIVVTADQIVIAGRPIISVADLEAYANPVEPALRQELEYQASRSRLEPGPQGRPVTIVADRELPYALLKKIMSTSVDAGYSAISLAVNRKSMVEGDG